MVVEAGADAAKNLASMLFEEGGDAEDGLGEDALLDDDELDEDEDKRQERQYEADQMMENRSRAEDIFGDLSAIFREGGPESEQEDDAFEEKEASEVESEVDEDDIDGQRRGRKVDTH